MSMINFSELDLKEESVIRINRVAKVNSRGKRFSFSTLVVIGDGKSYVGIGSGKANEVIVSINKAKENARQNLVKVPVINYTIPHEIIGKHGASRVLLKPAPYGTGIIAGSAVRLIMEQVGINNIYSKVLGSNNAMNVAKAVMNALTSLQDVRVVAKKRGKHLKHFLRFKMAKKQLKITQIKSRIGYSRKAKATLDALGLTKMNKSVIKEANEAIVGMIKKIDYLVKVEEV